MGTSTVPPYDVIIKPAPVRGIPPPPPPKPLPKPPPSESPYDVIIKPAPVRGIPPPPPPVPWPPPLEEPIIRAPIPGEEPPELEEPHHEPPWLRELEENFGWWTGQIIRQVMRDIEEGKKQNRLGLHNGVLEGTRLLGDANKYGFRRFLRNLKLETTDEHLVFQVSDALWDKISSKFPCSSGSPLGRLVEFSFKQTWNYIIFKGDGRKGKSHITIEKAERNVKNFVKRFGIEGFARLYFRNYLRQRVMSFLRLRSNRRICDLSYMYHFDNKGMITPRFKEKKFREKLAKECNGTAEILLRNFKKRKKLLPLV